MKIVEIMVLVLAMAMAIVGDLRQNNFWVWFIWVWTVAGG